MPVENVDKDEHKNQFVLDVKLHGVLIHTNFICVYPDVNWLFSFTEWYPSKTYLEAKRMQSFQTQPQSQSDYSQSLAWFMPRPTNASPIFISIIMSPCLSLYDIMLNKGS